MTKIGIELEHFVFDGNGNAPSIDLISTLYCRLCAEGYSFNKDQTVGVYKDTVWGRLYIKPDAYTHLLEIAFPPLSSLNDFSSIYGDTLETLSKALDDCGLHIEQGGCLHDMPLHYQIMASSDMQLARTKILAQRKLPLGNLAVPLFTSLIASTQVHLDQTADDPYSMSKKLYGIEYLFPLLFSSSKQFRNTQAHCIRPLIYRDNFVEGYTLTGFPAEVANSEAEYEGMVSQPWFIKDYSLIVPRAFRTIEFRGVDSLSSCNTILEMLALRLATRLVCAEIEPYENSRKHFYAVCESGRCDISLLIEHLLLLRQGASSLPTEVTLVLKKVFGEIESVIES